MYDDTIPTLQKLVSIPKAIVTNTPSACTHEILTNFGLVDFFQTVVCADEVAKAEPDPAVIFEACHRLNLNPFDIVIVGDTKSDVQTAEAAGCPIIGMNIKGDVTIARLSQILAYLINI